MWRALLVGIGGFLGSLARYWMGGWVQALRDGDFPHGTLAVNALGSFVLGVIVTLAFERGMLDPDVRLFLGVGVCGGFTTMSTFSYETVALLQRGLVGMAFLNAGLTLTACFGAVWAGMIAARSL